jgi:glycosyltransferase involved in cell wall biosynthesis
MHVLLISRCPPYPLHLGDRLIPYHLVSNLQARGHRVDLLAFYNQDEDAQAIEQYEHLFGSVELIAEPTRGSLDYLRRTATGRYFPAQAEEAWSPAMWQAIERRLAAARYDVAHLFGGVQVYEYRALVERLPNLIVPYESFSLFLQRQQAQTGSLARRLTGAVQLEMARRYERTMFSGYDRVVVLTEQDADSLRALNAGLPLQVIPNGIDLDYFTPQRDPAESPGTPLLLFVGNYEYGPNVDAALFLGREIFPLVRAELPEARLMLVGNGPPPELQVLAREGVEITGRVPDVRPYLERATVFVSPLRLGAGMKNKVLEAMAMARALVGTPLSADGIGLVEGEHILYGESAEALAEAVLRVVSSERLRMALAYANRALVEARFTWQAVAETYESLYKTLIAQRAVASQGG